jgi:uncharacterized protein (DUF433 family)
MSDHIYRDDCYEWPGGRSGKLGHPVVYSRRLGKCVYMHRVMFEAAFGPIPVGMVVRHKCDNPPCINPNHLEIGTQADNMRDMSERGRSTKALAPEQEHEICERHAAGESFDSIAEDFGVHSVTIGKAAAANAPGRGSHVKKLTWADRNEIRRRVAAGEQKKALADEFGVTPGAITYTIKHAIDNRGTRC